MNERTPKEASKLKIGKPCNHINTYLACSLQMKKYHCSSCEYKTHLKALFDRHQHNSKTASPSKTLASYVCPNCKQFDTDSILVFLKHIYESCNSRKWARASYLWYQCKLCSFKTKYHASVKIHTEKKHPEDLIGHDQVSTSHNSSKYYSLINHDNMLLTDIRWFQCAHCFYKTKSKQLLNRHEIKKHVSFKCDECNFIFKSKYYYQTHVKIKHSSTDTWFRCSQCPFKTKWQNYQKLHFRRTHCDFAFLKCEFCDFKTRFRETLTRHKIKHMPPEDVEVLHCPHCPYQCKIKIHLKKHLLLKHTDPSLIKWCHCDFCPYKAKQRCHLKNHIRFKHITHSESEYLKCDFCPYKTINKATLKKHTKAKHLPRVPVSEEKKFQCDICSFKTRHERHLKNHIITKHTTSENIEWVKCDKCSYKTKLKDYLWRHVKLQHTNSDDIVWEKCELCNFKTKQKAHLREHIQSKHTSRADLKLLRCKQCEYSTLLASTLRGHVSLKHKKA